MFQRAHQLLAIGFAIGLSGSLAGAIKSEAKQSAIEQIGSLEIRGGDIRVIQFTEDGGRYFLFLQDASKQAVTVVDVTDAAHPVVAREIEMPQGLATHAFANVTALSTDNSRGLVYLVDRDGLKILHKTVSPDPQVERDYTKHVLYDR